uniref:Uncharacterized protein n=1 Tax=Anguilla anguilla TaxID=7936 RepID=A0A0E9UVA3_ANGAN
MRPLWGKVMDQVQMQNKAGPMLFSHQQNS